MTSEFSDNRTSGKERKSPFIEEAGEAQWRAFRDGANQTQVQIMNKSPQEAQLKQKGKLETRRRLSKQNRKFKSLDHDGKFWNSTETNSSQAEGNWEQKQKIGGEHLEWNTWRFSAGWVQWKWGEKKPAEAQPPGCWPIRAAGGGRRFTATISESKGSREKREKSLGRGMIIIIKEKKQTEGRLKELEMRRHFTAGGSKIRFLFCSFWYSCFTDTLWLSHQGPFHISF